ncbi:MAG: sigma-54-dependent Fis family transcriptional regulator [Deltaproteobacteria bacterium]|nr:sigma-54-dependent Fis family transcriptional regulator [Deltaproteobacteria bacterium]
MASKKKKILVVDDEESIRDGCYQTLSRRGYQVDTIGDGLQGLDMAIKDSYDLILLDIRMPKIDGIEVLKSLKKDHNISAKIIIISGYGTIPLTVEAMKHGAFNFLTKPFNSRELIQIIKEALYMDEVSQKPEEEEHLFEMVGDSDYIKELKGTIKKIAKTDSVVLITGESGTGKELVARTIHILSDRSDKPFVPVDCSSLVENLMESELFGHVKGAFSGATYSRDGRFQRADKGSLFLDEISNISLSIQAKLLRVIQEQEVPKVGTTLPDKVDVRLITATNKDIRAEVEAGNFREDLFYRISVVPIHIKPLREHKSDILPITEYYLEIYKKKHHSKVRYLSEETKKSLLAYHWPGNIRELKNTIERLCVLCDHEVVTLSDILYYGQTIDTKAPIVDMFSGTMTLIDVEKAHIEKALRHFNGQINKTANFLGIDRKTLRMKIRNYGIEIKK